VARPDLPATLAARAGTVYETLKGKFYVDEAYEAVFLKPYYWLCRLMARFDETVVDGAVNLSGGAMEISGNVLKLFHSGFVRNYALIYLVGATVIFWYLLL
jgi:NADH:ubiquinone oxidoreductase subunit 5 (subunit L)/multisubunit Na+/H+ antiporter MnhA subunit